MKSVAFFATLPAFLALAASAQRPTIAVVDFSADQETGLVHSLPDQLAEDLVKSGQFEVFERSKLQSVLQEQGLQTSGFVDPDAAVTLGNLTGLDYLLTGQINDFGREVRQFRGFGVDTQTTFFRLKAGIRLIDAETGRVVFAHNATAEEKESNTFSNRVIDTTMDTRLAEIVSEELIGALVAQGIASPPEPDAQLATITITSSPENADVEIDGVFYGNAGGQFQVRPGLHQIKISLPGYEVWNKKVRVRDGMTFGATLIKRVDERIEVDIDQTTQSSGE